MSTDTAPPVDDAEQLHPTYVHSRREGIFILCLWACCMVWAVPFCYLTGYTSAEHPVTPENLETIWGIPKWTFYGIIVPWLLADVVTIWFCFRFMQDDDLGEAHEGADLEEEIAEMHAAKEGK